MRLSLAYSRQFFNQLPQTQKPGGEGGILGMIIYPPPMKVNKPNICVKKNDIDETGTKNG